MTVSFPFKRLSIWAALCVSLAACGGNGGGTNTTAPPPAALGGVFVSHTDETLTLTLPQTRTLDDLNGISVWCVQAQVDFGSGMFAPP